MLNIFFRVIYLSETYKTRGAPMSEATLPATRDSFSRGLSPMSRAVDRHEAPHRLPWRPSMLHPVTPTQTGFKKKNVKYRGIFDSTYPMQISLGFYEVRNRIRGVRHQLATYQSYVIRIVPLSKQFRILIRQPQAG